MLEADADPQQGGGVTADIWILFKDVVQVLLLLGAEIWVVTPRVD